MFIKISACGLYLENSSDFVYRYFQEKNVLDITVENRMILHDRCLLIVNIISMVPPHIPEIAKESGID